MKILLILLKFNNINKIEKLLLNKTVVRLILFTFKLQKIMKDFKKGLSFGMGIVNAGQRAANEEPELVIVSTPGSFRMTAQVSKALGIAHGEYVMFINNCANIDNAIINKVPEVVAFCEEQGLDIDSPEAAIAVHGEFDIWALAKGIAELDKNGNPCTTRVRMTKNDKVKYVNAYFQETLEGALSSSNEELKAALTREGITEDEQKELLISCIQGDEIAKIKGSKCANTAALSGIGVTLNFTDSNVWKQLKADMTDEEATSKNRVYTVDIDNLQEAVVNNGHKDIVVKIAMLTEYKDEEPIRIGKKAEKEETAE